MSKQTTLFSSWGSRKAKQATDTASHREVEAQVIAETDAIVDLCDDEDDDIMAIMAMEENFEQAPCNSSAFLNRFGQKAESLSSVCNTAGRTENSVIYQGHRDTISTGSSENIECLPGFDTTAGDLWIYPSNYPVRDYQFNIVKQALFKNTLVVLPTGLGKTFIAAVVMYNFYRWYPQGKIIFMAPTKPLVAQQIEACYNIMGITQDDTAEMTGAMQPSNRQRAWQSQRIFFLTPQVLVNDLSSGAIPADQVKCLIVDEAHKALGNHAYCQVVQKLLELNCMFRVVALSATPGSDIKAVQQVLTNLLISHVELRTEDSIDIKRYSHERKVEKIVVPLGEELSQMKGKYLQILEVIVKRLKKQGVLYNRDANSLTKFQVLKARDQFRQDPPHKLQKVQYGQVEGDFALCMSLYHGFELLQLHGLRSLYNYLEHLMSGDKGCSVTRAKLMPNATFCELMDSLRQKFDPIKAPCPNVLTQFSPMRASQLAQPYVVGHPKLEKLQSIVLEHFANYQPEGHTDAVATRIMIFSQYRDSVNEITEMLNRHRPLVKVMSFIGQSSAGKSSKGFTQKDQLKVMKRFREGGYNTLVSTCVGEEGLDIGDVDLIICFDASKSPIRLVQRMGRTGRKREGRIVMLVTQGKEEQIYNQGLYSKKSIHKAILSGTKSLQFYPNSPRMVPKGTDPVCHKMFVSVKEKFKEKLPTAKSKSTSINEKTMVQKGNKTPFLLEQEMKYYQEHFEISPKTVKHIPIPSYLSLKPDNNGQQEHELSSQKFMNLSNWTEWQNRLQPAFAVNHSNKSKHLVELMEFMEIQAAVDESEDPYGIEMRMFLKSDDIIKNKPRHTVANFCTPVAHSKYEAKTEECDPDFQVGSNQSRKQEIPRTSYMREKVKRSEQLPVIEFGTCESDNSDDDLVPMQEMLSKSPHKGGQNNQAATEVSKPYISKVLNQDNNLVDNRKLSIVYSSKSNKNGNSGGIDKGISILHSAEEKQTEHQPVDSGKKYIGKNQSEKSVSFIDVIEHVDEDVCEFDLGESFNLPVSEQNNVLKYPLQEDKAQVKKHESKFLDAKMKTDENSSLVVANNLNSTIRKDNPMKHKKSLQQKKRKTCHVAQTEPQKTLQQLGFKGSACKQKEKVSVEEMDLSHLFPIFSPDKHNDEVVDLEIPKVCPVIVPPSEAEMQETVKYLQERQQLSPVDLVSLVQQWEKENIEKKLSTLVLHQDLLQTSEKSRAIDMDKTRKVSIPDEDIYITCGRTSQNMLNSGTEENKQLKSRQVFSEARLDGDVQSSKLNMLEVSSVPIIDDFVVQDIQDNSQSPPSSPIFQSQIKSNTDMNSVRYNGKEIADQCHTTASDDFICYKDPVDKISPNRLKLSRNKRVTEAQDGLDRGSQQTVKNIENAVDAEKYTCYDLSKEQESLFDSSFDDIAFANFKTPALSHSRKVCTSDKDLSQCLFKTPISAVKEKAPEAESSQVSFTQALDMVHCSNKKTQVPANKCGTEISEGKKERKAEIRNVCKINLQPVGEQQFDTSDQILISDSEMMSVSESQHINTNISSMQKDIKGSMSSEILGQSGESENKTYSEEESECLFDLGFDLEEFEKEIALPAEYKIDCGDDKTTLAFMESQGFSDVHLDRKDSSHCKSLDISKSKSSLPFITSKENGKGTLSHNAPTCDNSGQDLPTKYAAASIHPVAIVTPHFKSPSNSMCRTSLLSIGQAKASSTPRISCDIKKNKLQTNNLAQFSPSTRYQPSDTNVYKMYKGENCFKQVRTACTSPSVSFLEPAQSSWDNIQHEDTDTPVKPTKTKKRGNIVFSSDDDTPVKPAAKRMATLAEFSDDDDFAGASSSKICPKSQHKSKASVIHFKQKPNVRKKPRRCAFIEEEAILSDVDGEMSSDDEDSDMDHLDHSFINDATQMSQEHAINTTDMHAFYMKSVRSPVKHGIPGKYRLNYNKDMNVFSQVPDEEEENEYVEDSFCVNDDAEESGSFNESSFM